MPFTKEHVDFSGLNDQAIKTKLAEFNIPLTAPIKVAEPI